MRLLILISLIVIGKCENFINFKNYKLVEVTPRTEEQVEFLKDLKKNCETITCQSFSFMKFPGLINQAVHMLVPSDTFELIHQVIRSKFFKPLLITKTMNRIWNNENLTSNKIEMDWKYYHSYETICDWLSSLVEKYPKNVEIFNYGKSFEDRNILGVKLSFHQGRKAIFLEGGIHGSSFISPATVTYILNEFLTTKNKTRKSLAGRYDWYFVPSINPDSYEFAQCNVFTRFWHKTRSYTSSTYLCPGVNADRNFKYMWSETGSSDCSCSDFYTGKKAFTEAETRSLANFLKNNSEHLFAYISFQSNGQNLMIPYGYTNDRLDNFDEMIVIAQKTAVALHRRFGTRYRVGTVYEGTGGASGTSTDWVKSCLGLPVVITYQMRPKEGYMLDPEFIIPNAEEIVDSLVVLFSESSKLGYGNV